MTQTLFSELLESARNCGLNKVIAEDISKKPITYRNLLLKSQVLAYALKKIGISEGKYIGLLMPNSLAGMISFFALQALDKAPAMLNFTASEKATEAAIEMAKIKTVITSRTFIEKGELGHLIDVLKKKTEVIYLEDLKPLISFTDKIRAAFMSFATFAFRPAKVDGNEPAVILFTSGSEGLPKGVALSHNNILANVRQVAEKLKFYSGDKLFSSLPMFHSFGLTVGTILPLMLGVRVFLYPTPLHYKIIPGLVNDTGSTIILGTDTFFKGYAHYAKDDDFSSVRIAVAGAEKLRDATFDIYKKRFNVEIYQGYGVTETSPVISCNTPEEHRPGTVGKLFPYQEGRIEPVEGISSGGRLFIKGPNVMLGYIKLENPGVIEPLGEWHDTGDIVELDEDGFVKIVGRAKRFAKIGGEMVSLAAVEELAHSLNPDHSHAAIAVADEKKGEQVIIYTECSDLTRDSLIKHANSIGYAEIGIPRVVKYIESIPRLGNGKIDYPALNVIKS